jgi:hypothetical protein
MAKAATRIAAEEVERDLEAILDRVEFHGERFEVIVNGVVAALIQPPEPKADPSAT